jgi:hypothetical protein
VSDEGDALGGAQTIENHQQREPDGFGERHFVLGIASRCDRFDLCDVDWFLTAAAVAHAEHLEANATGDRGQPSGHVGDGARLDPAGS